LSDVPSLVERERRIDRPLSGQVAIVTGAGRGIGRAIAEGLAAAGASVAVAARTLVEVETTATAVADRGGRGLPVAADVTDATVVDALVSAVRSELGPPTLLVNNAGTWLSVGPVETADPDRWWRDVEVSVRGTFLCTRAVLPLLLEQGGGRIVNVASRAGTDPRPNGSGYAAAKAAVLSFTRSLAAEVAPRGVSVFAMSPGFVRTALIDRVISLAEGKSSPAGVRDREDDLRPELSAELVVDIATGRLDILTGRFLHVLDDLDELLADARRHSPADAA
jgi:NAD(P)-dependent dehydrogenase (short-subunit alcohol dehydrogenase family)